jgi:hypothetical protein
VGWVPWRGALFPLSFSLFRLTDSSQHRRTFSSTLPWRWVLPYLSLSATVSRSVILCVFLRLPFPSHPVTDVPPPLSSAPSLPAPTLPSSIVAHAASASLTSTTTPSAASPAATSTGPMNSTRTVSRWRRASGRCIRSCGRSIARGRTL